MLKQIFASALLSLSCLTLFSADSGAVTEGIQRFAGKKIFKADGLRDATLAAHDTLTVSSQRFQRLDPDGTHRNVTLPAEEDNAGLWYFVINSGNDSNLVVKDDAGNTIVTVEQAQCAHVICSGTAWKGMAYGAAFSGALNADGSVAGSTGQAQDFGTNGIKADVIAESTGATGVTIDGVLIKDTTVDLNGTADALILDADGNTSICASTDNQIDIEVNNADDFTFTANTFTALSGSTIATNTIAETTAGSGVTIDGVLVKDGDVAIGDSAGDHAITIKSGTDEAANYDLTIPDLSANDTLMTLGTAQTVTGVKTMSGANVIKFANTGLTLNDAGADHVLTLKTATDEAAAYDVVIPDLAGNDTLMTLATAQTVTGVKTFSASLAGDGIPMYKEVAVSNAEMLDLADTPKELIAAPGAGKVIEIVSVSFYFDYVGAYTVTANDDLDICYGTEANVIMTAEATGFVDATADTALFGNRVDNYAPAKTACDNAAVVLANNSTDFGGGNAGNEVTVKINYRIWTTGW